MNGWDLPFDEDEYTNLVVSVAAGVLTKAELSDVFELRCKPVES